MPRNSELVNFRARVPASSCPVANSARGGASCAFVNCSRPKTSAVPGFSNSYSPCHQCWRAMIFTSHIFRSGLSFVPCPKCQRAHFFSKSMQQLGCSRSNRTCGSWEMTRNCVLLRETYAARCAARDTSSAASTSSHRNHATRFVLCTAKDKAKAASACWPPESWLKGLHAVASGLQASIQRDRVPQLSFPHIDPNTEPFMPPQRKL